MPRVPYKEMTGGVYNLQTYSDLHLPVGDILTRMVDQFVTANWGLHQSPAEKKVGRKWVKTGGERFVLKFSSAADMRRVALALFGVALPPQPLGVWSTISLQNVHLEDYAKYLDYLGEAQAA